MSNGNKFSQALIDQRDENFKDGDIRIAIEAHKAAASVAEILGEDKPELSDEMREAFKQYRKAQLEAGPDLANRSIDY